MIFLILIFITLIIKKYFDKIEQFTILYVNNDNTNGKYGITCSKCRNCVDDEYLSGCGGTSIGTCIPTPEAVAAIAVIEKKKQEAAAILAQQQHAASLLLIQQQNAARLKQQQSIWNMWKSFW